MNILVLDTIHGGRTIAEYLTASDCLCDTVDVYRHESGISEEEAVRNLTLKRYDFVCAPIHLSPEYCILKSAAAEGIPVLSHHEIVSLIVSGLSDADVNSENAKPIIEITGTRGKTTTAYALSHMLSHAVPTEPEIPPKNSRGNERGINERGINERGILHTSRETVAVPGGRILQKLAGAQLPRIC